jgi:hypothetical protein
MKNLFLLASGLMLIFLSGCENNDLLLSEKKLNSKIQKTWKIVSPSPSSDYSETWSFQGGSVTIINKVVSSTGVDSTVTNGGSYSIDAKFSKAYVNISNFNYVGYIKSGFEAKVLNRKWTIVELDNGIMYLSGVDDNGIIRSMEFVER